MVPGPPAVSAQIMSKMRTRSRPRISMAMAITGQMAGNTMRRKVRKYPAPLNCRGFRLGPVDIGKRRKQDQEHERRPLPDLAETDRRITRFGLMVHSAGPAGPRTIPTSG